MNAILAVVVAIAAIGVLVLVVASRHSRARALDLGALRADAGAWPEVSAGKLVIQTASSGDCVSGALETPYLVLVPADGQQGDAVERTVQELLGSGWRRSDVGEGYERPRTGYVERARAGTDRAGSLMITLSSDATSYGTC